MSIYMKRLFIVLAAAAVLSACDLFFDPIVLDPIDISSPEPTETLTKVTLSEEQQTYMNAGNAFAFNCLEQLYDGNTVIFSPLSLQFALAMAVNGASGETAEEITKALGYGTDVKALNRYCNLLLNQLPALDKNVALKLTDAMMVLEDFPCQKDFTKILNEQYYAPIEYFSPATKKEIIDRINEWASRNTNGFIKPFLNEGDITDDFVAAILNALYFKAKWSEGGNGPMFMEENTLKNQDFIQDNNGGKKKVDMMRTSDYLPYAQRNGYKAVSIPYGNGSFAMYLLLPDKSGVNGAAELVKQLSKESWKDITSSLSTGYLVHLKMPKFEAENKLALVETMQTLGIERAFVGGVAQFDSMFDVTGWDFWISNILQKARISVAEWGTEAAAVTAIIMDKATSVGPGQIKEVTFTADHPFVYVIAERSSGAILFEGVFAGC